MKYVNADNTIILDTRNECAYSSVLGPPQTRVKKQETKNKKQNGLAHSRFIVCVTPKQKKNIAWFENQVLAEHVRKSQSTIYLKSHGCVHGFQNEVSLINFSTMFCKPCSLSRNRSLRDAKSARHMFVWFAKHCLAEHCSLFRGDADECQKQFCFVFRICLAFFDSRLWRPLRFLDLTAQSQERIFQSFEITAYIQFTATCHCIYRMRHVYWVWIFW